MHLWQNHSKKICSILIHFFHLLLLLLLLSFSSLHNTNGKKTKRIKKKKVKKRKQIKSPNMVTKCYYYFWRLDIVVIAVMLFMLPISFIAHSIQYIFALASLTIIIWKYCCYSIVADITHQIYNTVTVINTNKIPKPQCRSTMTCKYWVKDPFYDQERYHGRQ